MKPYSGFHAGPVLLVCILCGLCIPHTTCGTHFAKTVAPPRPGHQLLSEAHRVGVLACGLTEVLPFRQSSSVERGLRVAVFFKDHLMPALWSCSRFFHTVSMATESQFLLSLLYWPSSYIQDCIAIFAFSSFVAFIVLSNIQCP